MSKTSVSAMGLAALLMLAVACGDGGGKGSGGSGGGGPAAGTGGGGSAAGGRGGGGGSGGSGGGNITASPCYPYCMAREIKKDCKPESSIEDCVGYTFGCEDFNTRSSGCKTALMAYWSCTAAQADPCDNPGTCTAQAEALGTACN